MVKFERLMPEEFEMSQTRPIGVPEWRLLLALAYDGPQNMYHIAKKHNFKYPLVHRATLSLEKMNWITVVERRLSEKNISTKIYSLTGEGLLWLFSRIPKKIPPPLMDESVPDESHLREAEEKDVSEPENLETQADVHVHLLFEFNVNKIAKANRALLPLIFEDWDFFRSIGISEDLAWRFPEIAFSTLIEYCRNWEGLKDRFDTLEKIFAYKLFRAHIESLGNASAELEKGMKKELLQQLAALFSHNPPLKELLRQIVIELEANLKENLAFIGKIRLSLTT